MHLNLVLFVIVVKDLEYMKILTEVQSKIHKDYYFIVGKTNIDNEYFKHKIETGINLENNRNFQTNVKSYMTNWQFFIDDINFLNFLLPIFDKIDTYPNVPPYYLQSAWGIKENFSHRTTIHNHESCFMSGVLYLNNHSQVLNFPEIQKSVKPEKNKFVIFSSFLNHYADRNKTTKSKYAIAFNLGYKLNYQ